MKSSKFLVSLVIALFAVSLPVFGDINVNLNLMAEHCSNEILDSDETGVDCGGECASCQIDNCQDGIRNNGEVGIDCGGNCAECIIEEINIPISWRQYSDSEIENNKDIENIQIENKSIEKTLEIIINRNISFGLNESTIFFIDLNLNNTKSINVTIINIPSFIEINISSFLDSGKIILFANPKKSVNDKMELLISNGSQNIIVILHFEAVDLSIKKKIEQPKRIDESNYYIIESNTNSKSFVFIGIIAFISSIIVGLFLIKKVVFKKEH